jgi:hypothetical protein
MSLEECHLKPANAKGDFSLGSFYFVLCEHSPHYRKLSNPFPIPPDLASSSSLPATVETVQVVYINSAFVVNSKKTGTKKCNSVC